MKKEHCNGCESNFYNGNNPFGVEECWHFKEAKLVKRIMIGHWESPPYKDKKVINKLNCFSERGSNRTHYVSPDKISKEGYWK